MSINGHFPMDRFPAIDVGDSSDPAYFSEKLADIFTDKVIVLCC